MENKKFTKKDEGFVCKNCGKQVLPLGYTSRDHCPYCLASLHIDINPGDRANSCGGLMLPIEINYSTNKGYVICYKCTKCGRLHNNKSATDDNFDEMLKIMQNRF
jgi:hypothetical protein